MFATQNYVDAMSDPGRKRGRDGEEDTSNASMGFGEHRNKRIQCLPLRTSPKSSQQWQASSITPLNSDSDEPIPQSHFSPWSSSPALSSQPQGNVEMDMMDSATPTPLNGPGGHHPSGRMPTPIQPSFAAQIRGQQCEWAGPGPVVTSLNGVVNMGHHHSGFSDDQCVPRAMSGVADWHSVQNNRRLPSPISEAEDSMMVQGYGETVMAMDDDSNACAGQEGHAEMHAASTRCMEHPNAMMDVEAISQCQGDDSEGDGSSPSPARRGHMRSKHTINSWTWQPGMKKSFSIGYRADCEKCRLKVPGHFNHIIVS